MKKIIKLFSVAFFSVCLFVGCNNSEAVKEEKIKDSEVKVINFIVPDGLPAMSVSKLIKENTVIDNNYNITYSIEQSSDALTTAVMKGEADIAIVPSNVAAVAFNKNGDYKIAATIGWGSFYLGTVKDNDSIDGVKGNEVYNIGKGLTPDITARVLLNFKGINPDTDINLSYVDGVSELAPIILSGRAKYAVIPEPALSTVKQKNNNFKTIMNLNDEWKKMYNSEYGYPQSTLIVKKDLAENHKEFLSKALNTIEEDVNWIYENKEGCGQYCEDLDLSVKKNIVGSAIDNSNIKYVSIENCRNEYKNYYEKLNEFNPKTIGGKLPNDEIFMEN